MYFNTLRALDFSTSLHLTLFEWPAGNQFFNTRLAPRPEDAVLLPGGAGGRSQGSGNAPFSCTGAYTDILS
jgi:hypothetical protein